MATKKPDAAGDRKTRSLESRNLVTMSIYVTPEERKAWRVEALEQDTSVSGLVRGAMAARPKKPAKR